MVPFWESNGFKNLFGLDQDNPFADPANKNFDRGANIDPFSALRQALPGQLFTQANIFGQQGQGFLNSRGMFDPNMAEAIRLRSFGGAQSSLAQALAALSGQEGTFREGQREFNVGQDFGYLQNKAEWDAAQPNIYDFIAALSGVAQGAARFSGGMGG